MKKLIPIAAGLIAIATLTQAATISVPPGVGAANRRLPAATARTNAQTVGTASPPFSFTPAAQLARPQTGGSNAFQTAQAARSSAAKRPAASRGATNPPAQFASTFGGPVLGSNSTTISERIVDRGQNHSKHEIVRSVVDSHGKARFQTNSFTTLESGMHYLENGKWVKSNPQLVCRAKLIMRQKIV